MRLIGLARHGVHVERSREYVGSLLSFEITLCSEIGKDGGQWRTLLVFISARSKMDIGVQAILLLQEKEQY
jgi:hypothetical protein